MAEDKLPDGDVEWLHSTTRENCQKYYATLWKRAEKDHSLIPAIAELGRQDRFFLLTWILNRPDADRDWIYSRCREVEAEPDDYLDLWAREHYKSTIITFAGAIQAVLQNPEITIGLFSVTYSRAVEFLRQIKAELERNERLKGIYPDVLWKNPEREAPLWSEQNGIIVKRKSNPREATVTAHGLIEGLPAGPHYALRIYDDIITDKEVSTPEMMQKAMDMWRQSQNLGREGGRRWHAGTRYHFNDPYSVIIREHLLKVRIRAATDDGTLHGKPVLFSEESLAKKYRELGSYIFSCQQLLDPVADEAQGFKREWLRYWTPPEDEKPVLNIYLTVDPASKKKKYSDFTVIWVLGLGPDRNYYILDCVRDRLNLTERADALFNLHKKYHPLNIAYEEYGLQADIEHMQDRMNRENYRFGIQAVGGKTQKEDRIRRLVPLFQQGRIYIPENIWSKPKDGRKIDLVKTFIEQEFVAFPVSVHDDMLDSMSRILDPEFSTMFPRSWDEAEPKRETRYVHRRNRNYHQGSWMSV